MDITPATMTTTFDKVQTKIHTLWSRLQGTQLRNSEVDVTVERAKPEDTYDLRITVRTNPSKSRLADCLYQAVQDVLDHRDTEITVPNVRESNERLWAIVKTLNSTTELEGLYKHCQDEGLLFWLELRNYLKNQDDPEAFTRLCNSITVMSPEHGTLYTFDARHPPIEALDIVTEGTAKLYGIIPIRVTREVDDSTLFYVAINPFDPRMNDDLEFLLNMPCKCLLSYPVETEMWLNLLYPEPNR